MKKFKSLTILCSLALTPFFIGCDGDSGNEEVNNELNQPVVRGLDLNEIQNNPTSTPGFPFTLSDGETITFLATDTPADSFIEQVPLGTWVVESSGFVRQGENSTGNLYFPVTEHSFRHFYVTAETEQTPTTVSTQENAFLEYTFEHRVERGQFADSMDQIIQQSVEPGSLQHALTTAGRISDRNRVIVDAVSSVGMAAVDYPGPNTSLPAVRTFREITLSNISSTNAELDGDNPTITGSYTLIDTWHETATDFGGDGVELNLLFVNGEPVRFREESSGTFIIRLNGLTRQP